MDILGQFLAAMPVWAAWSLTLTLLFLGLLGAVVPLLPGPFLILLAGVLHTWLCPTSAMSVVGIIVLILLVALAYFVDFSSGMIGARKFGASRWGVIGVLVGGVIGFFFGLLGLIFGPLIGAFGFELLFARQEVKAAAKSTWGTLLGTGIGLLARVAVCVLMILVFLLDALVV